MKLKRNPFKICHCTAGKAIFDATSRSQLYCGGNDGKTRIIDMSKYLQKIETDDVETYKSDSGIASRDKSSTSIVDTRPSSTKTDTIETSAEVHGHRRLRRNNPVDNPQVRSF